MANEDQILGSLIADEATLAVPTTPRDVPVRKPPNPRFLWRDGLGTAVDCHRNLLLQSAGRRHSVGDTITAIAGVDAALPAVEFPVYVNDEGEPEPANDCDRTQNTPPEGLAATATVGTSRRWGIGLVMNLLKPCST